VAAHGADGALRSALSRASRRSSVLASLRALPPHCRRGWSADSLGCQRIATVGLSAGVTVGRCRHDSPTILC
jgi:hypothetical protein